MSGPWHIHVDDDLEVDDEVVETIRERMKQVGINAQQKLDTMIDENSTGKFKVEVTREWIADALRQSYDSEEVPEDAFVVGLEYNANRDLYEVVLGSESVPRVLEGSVVPKLHELDATNE